MEIEVSGKAIVHLHVRLEEVELWRAPEPVKKRKLQDVENTLSVPNGFPFALVSEEQSVKMMSYMVSTTLYALYARSDGKVRMLHDPDAAFASKSMPARALALPPCSTDIVKEKD